ncbi:hypothetical protein [Caballeronia glebae]|uniref:hypothetical protein n=1 Tax=Caballeronia glebae TaxID=1777143 RepID=UPI0038BDEBC6
MNKFDILFNRYTAELRGALAAARAWWEALEARERENAATQESDFDLEHRWPFGYYTHPYVLGVCHKYHLLLEAMNEASEASAAEAQVEAQAPAAQDTDWGEDDVEPDTTGDDEETAFTDMDVVEPSVLLIDALHGDQDDLADAVTWIVYWPVGVDEHDRLI